MLLNFIKFVINIIEKYIIIYFINLISKMSFRGCIYVVNNLTFYNFKNSSKSVPVEGYTSLRPLSP